MDVTVLTVGELQTNCYLLAGPEGCLVIDPGAEPGKILRALDGRRLAAILLTHGHFDHVGAVRELAAQTGCEVYIHPAELALPTPITAGPLYHTHTYEDGDRRTVAGLSFTVLHTPGHTPGSVCLCFEEQMFSGDTLFVGGFGRTDLPGGDGKLLRQSLGRLAALEQDYRLWPGHGAFGSLRGQMGYIPFW